MTFLQVNDNTRRITAAKEIESHFQAVFPMFLVNLIIKNTVFIFHKGEYHKGKTQLNLEI